MPKKRTGKTNTNGTTEVVMYLRYSSMHQRSVSLDEQRLANMKYCLENNYTCIKEYSDAALSGKTDHRPAFQQMIKDAMNSPQFSKIVVYDLTRFSRKEADFARYNNMLSDRNIQVVSATQYFDASSAGRFQRRVKLSVINKEYMNGNLFFRLDQDIPEKWFSHLISAAYKHTYMVGYAPKNVKRFGKDQIYIRLYENERKDTIVSIVQNVSDWITKTNKIYANDLRRQVFEERRAKEDAIKEELEKREKEIDINGFLAGL